MKVLRLSLTCTLSVLPTLPNKKNPGFSALPTPVSLIIIYNKLPASFLSSFASFSPFTASFRSFLSKDLDLLRLVLLGGERFLYRPALYGCLGLLDLDLTRPGVGERDRLRSYRLGGDLFLQFLDRSRFSRSERCCSLSRSRDFSRDRDKRILSQERERERFLDEER